MSYTGDGFLDGLSRITGIRIPKGNDDESIARILRRMQGGTSRQESGGLSSIVNPDSGAVGEFQVMPENIPSWTRRHLGKSLTPEQFKANPQAQRDVFAGEMGEYIRKALRQTDNEDEVIRRAAAAWYGGEGAMGRFDDPTPQVTNGHKYPSFRDYTTSVLRKSFADGPQANDFLDGLKAIQNTDFQPNDFLSGLQAITGGGIPVASDPPNEDAVLQLQQQLANEKNPTKAKVIADQIAAIAKQSAQPPNRPLLTLPPAGSTAPTGVEPPTATPSVAETGSAPAPPLSGQRKVVAGKKVVKKVVSPTQTPAPTQVPAPQPTEEDYQQWRDYAGHPDDTPLSRKQFADALATSSVKGQTAVSGYRPQEYEDATGQTYTQESPARPTKAYALKDAGQAEADVVMFPRQMKSMQEADDYLRSQLKAKYGIDPNVIQAGASNWSPDAKGVSVSYDALKQMGVDTEPMIREKVAQQRVENPTPDLSLPNPQKDLSVIQKIRGLSNDEALRESKEADPLYQEALQNAPEDVENEYLRLQSNKKLRESQMENNPQPSDVNFMFGSEPLTAAWNRMLGTADTAGAGILHFFNQIPGVQFLGGGAEKYLREMGGLRESAARGYDKRNPDQGWLEQLAHSVYGLAGELPYFMVTPGHGIIANAGKMGGIALAKDVGRKGFADTESLKHTASGIVAGGILGAGGVLAENAKTGLLKAVLPQTAIDAIANGTASLSTKYEALLHLYGRGVGVASVSAGAGAQTLLEGGSPDQAWESAKHMALLDIALNAGSDITALTGGVYQVTDGIRKEYVTVSPKGEIVPLERAPSKPDAVVDITPFRLQIEKIARQGESDKSTDQLKQVESLYNQGLLNDKQARELSIEIANGVDKSQELDAIDTTPKTAERQFIPLPETAKQDASAANNDTISPKYDTAAANQDIPVKPETPPIPVPKGNPNIPVVKSETIDTPEPVRAYDTSKTNPMEIGAKVNVSQKPESETQADQQPADRDKWFQNLDNLLSGKDPDYNDRARANDLMRYAVAHPDASQQDLADLLDRARSAYDRSKKEDGSGSYWSNLFWDIAKSPRASKETQAKAQAIYDEIYPPLTDAERSSMDLEYNQKLLKEARAEAVRLESEKGKGVKQARINNDRWIKELEDKINVSQKSESETQKEPITIEVPERQPQRRVRINGYNRIVESALGTELTPAGDAIRRRVNTLADQRQVSVKDLEKVIQSDPQYALDFARGQAEKFPDDAAGFNKVAKVIEKHWPKLRKWDSIDRQNEAKVPEPTKAGQPQTNKPLTGETQTPLDPSRAVHSLEITPQMKESVMGGQPLFSKVNDIPDHITAHEGRPTGELIGRTDITRTDSHLTINNPETYELIRQLSDDYRHTNGMDPQGHYLGLMFKSDQVEHIQNALKKLADPKTLKEKGYDDAEIAKFQTLRKAFDVAGKAEVTNSGKRVVTVGLSKELVGELAAEAARAEEQGHGIAFLKSASDTVAGQNSNEWRADLNNNELFSNASNLHRDYAGMPEPVIKHEFITKLATGQFEYLGIDPIAQKDAIIETVTNWAKDFNELNKGNILEAFKQINETTNYFFERYQEHVAEIESGTNRPNTAESSGRSIGSQEGRTDVSGNAEAVQDSFSEPRVPQGEPSGRPKNDDLASLPQTLRKYGQDAIDFLKKKQSHSETTDKGIELFRQYGIDGGIQFLDNLKAKELAPEQTVLKGLIYKTLQDYAAATGNAEAQAKADRFLFDWAVTHTRAGQYNDAVRLLENAPAIKALAALNKAAEEIGGNPSDKVLRSYSDLADALTTATARISFQEEKLRTVLAENERLRNEQPVSPRARQLASASRRKIVKLVHDNFDAEVAKALKQIEGVSQMAGALTENGFGKLPQVIDSKEHDPNSPNILEMAAKKSDPRAVIGAMKLVDGIASGNYSPDQFKADMEAQLGEVKDFQQLYKDSVNLRNEWLDQITKTSRTESAARILSRDLPEGADPIKASDLSDQQVLDLMGKSRDLKRSRDLVEKMHQYASGVIRKKVSPELRQFIGDMKDSDAQAAAALLRAGNTKPSDFYRIMAEKYPDADAQKLFVEGDTLFNRAKDAIDKHVAEIKAKATERSNMVKDIDLAVMREREAHDHAAKQIQDELSRLKNPKWHATKETWHFLGGITRNLTLSGEFSFLLRQGGKFVRSEGMTWMPRMVGLMSDPHADIRSQYQPTREAFKSLVSERDYAHTLSNIERDMDFPQAQKFGLDFSTAGKTGTGVKVGEEQLHTDTVYTAADWLQKQGDKNAVAKALTAVPVKYLEGLGRFDKSMAVFQDVLRLKMWKLMSAELKDNGYTPENNPEQFQELARRINSGTGRPNKFNVKALQLASDAVRHSELALAPGYTIAKWQDMGADLKNTATSAASLVAYRKLDPTAQRATLQKAMNSYGALAITYGLMAYAAGGTISFDPDDDDYLKVKVGEYRYDLSQGNRAELRFISRIIKHATLRDFGGYNTPSNLIGGYVRPKLNVIPQFGYSTVTGSDAIGQPFSPADPAVYAKMLFPMVYTSAAQAAMHEYTGNKDNPEDDSFLNAGKGVLLTMPFDWFGGAASLYTDKSKDLRKQISEARKSGASQEQIDWLESELDKAEIADREKKQERQKARVKEKLAARGQ